MSGIKRSSYPSRQRQGGPAPLASFEDLSDEIESPEEQTMDVSTVHELDLTPGNETEDDAKTYSDGVTPSTPRVLAQTPSTPLALDDFSAAGSPDSLGPCEVSSRPDTPLRKESAATSSSRSSIFSPRSSPLFGRRLKATTPDLQVGAGSQMGKSMEFLDEGQTSGWKKSPAGSKSGPGTPSPRSARKFFTMSFFKPKEDKTPSPTAASPKSPRKMSPVSSPKSPVRRVSPFAGLFKSTGKENGDPSAASPTKKKGHFSHFLRVKDERKQSLEQNLAQVSTVDHSRKEGRHGVLATLFRRTDHKESGSAKPAVSPLESSPSGHAPDNDDWLLAPSTIPGSLLTRIEYSGKEVSVPPIVTDHFEMSRDSGSVSTSDDHIPSCSPADGLLVGTQGIFESSQDIAGGSSISMNYDPKLHIGSSPSTDTPHLSSSSAVLGVPQAAPADQDRLPSSEEECLHSAAATTAPNIDKMSPESEVDIPEADPAVLKTLKKDEPEAETLLREDSFEADEFITPDILQPVEGAKQLQQQQQTEKEVSRHRDKMAAFRTNPVDRPRSTAPISFASLDAYINIVAPSKNKGGPGMDADKEKLKVILPGEEFEHKSRGSVKRAVYKSWFEFCEVGLQSPRSRRRQGGERLAAKTPSSAPASRETTIDEDERRAESLDFGFVMTSADRWPAFESHGRVQQNGRRPPSDGNSDSSTAASPTSATIPFEDCGCECHDRRLQRHSNSSGCSFSSGSSPKDFAQDDLHSQFLRDEEVEPLVQEVDSMDDFLVGDDCAAPFGGAISDPCNISFMPDCISSAVPMVPMRIVPLPDPDSTLACPTSSLDDLDNACHSQSQMPPPPVNGSQSVGVMDLLASLPSPKRERHGSWFPTNAHVLNGKGQRRSSDSVESDDTMTTSGPLVSQLPVIHSKGEDM